MGFLQTVVVFREWGWRTLGIGRVQVVKEVGKGVWVGLEEGRLSGGKEIGFPRLTVRCFSDFAHLGA